MLQSSSSEKKLVKLLKNCFFGPNLHRKGVITAHSQHRKRFFSWNNKSRSSAFRKFLFYQNIICFDWVMSLFLSWEMFSVKKVLFPAKTAVIFTFFITLDIIWPRFCPKITPNLIFFAGFQWSMLGQNLEQNVGQTKS